MNLRNSGAGSSRMNSSPPLTPPPPLLSRKRPRLATGEEDWDSSYIPLSASVAQPIHLRGGGKARHKPTANAQRAKCTPESSSGRKRVTRARARRNSSPSIATDLESIASEDAAVKQEISRLNLALRDVQGDGNCLFRALADQLWGTQKRHVEVRKVVCDYLESHKESMEAFVKPFLRDDETYENYVDRMRQAKQFGSHIEIQAAARVFRRNIRVVMSTTSFTIPWESESTTKASRSDTDDEDEDGDDEPHHRTRSTNTTFSGARASSSSHTAALAEYLPPIRPGRSMLWLALFSLAEHFQSVRRRGDRESSVAEVEDSSAVPHQRDTSEAARRERGEVVDKAAPSAKVAEVLASLPPGHGVSARKAEGILARVKGDLGEAVEILLDDLELDSLSDTSSDHVDNLLTQPPYREDSVSASSSQSDGGISNTSETSKLTTPADSSDEKVVTGINDLNMFFSPEKAKLPPKVLREAVSRELRGERRRNAAMRRSAVV